ANYIGRATWNADQNLPAIVDEARVSNVARSASWAKLDYETQKPTASAVSFGATQSQASGLSYSLNDAIYLVNAAIDTNKPLYTGASSGWSISPNLPNGLSINSSTGDITGT